MNKAWWRIFWPTIPAAVLSITLLIWTALGSFVCVSLTNDELKEVIDLYSKMFAALDTIVDVDIKLTTTLAGIGAAVLIGLKSGTTLPVEARVWILIATLLFTLSTFCALWWRLGIAEIWLNSCLDGVTAPRYQRRFEAH